MASLNDLVLFFQNNPQIITQLTSGKLDLSGIMNVLKQAGINAAKSEVEEYIAKNVNLGDVAKSVLGGAAGNNAGNVLSGLGSVLGGKKEGINAADVIGGLGSLLGGK